MDCCRQWKPIVVMVAVNLGLAAANALLKKILDGGLNHLVILAYRQVIAMIFLAPIAYFWERKSRPKLTVPILCQLFFSALMGVIGSIIVVIGLYILLWGKSKEIEECQEMKQAQLAPQDGHFDAVSLSHIIPVTQDSSKP